MTPGTPVPVQRPVQRLRRLRIAQPRSLRSRQLWAASFGLIAFLAFNLLIVFSQHLKQFHLIKMKLIVSCTVTQ